MDPSGEPLVYPSMQPAERESFCAAAPWWTAPLVVGGSGGSGTRASVLLAARLGVGMACERPLFDPAVLDERSHCNRASDFDLLGGKPMREPPLVWLGTGCELEDDLLARRLNASDGTGKGLDATSLRALRFGLLPQFRRPLRWGMKNPHAIYLLKLLLRFFPCMVYVNTLRELPEMVRNMDHLRNRFEEADTYGLLQQSVAEGPLGAKQAWLAGYLIRINSGLATWAARCIPPQRIIYLSTMRLARCISDTCTAFVATRLANSLGLDPNSTHRAVGEFAWSSHKLVETSAQQSAARPLLVRTQNGTPLTWPSTVTALSGDESYCHCAADAQDPSP